MYLHLLEFKFRYIMLYTVEYQVYIVLQFPGHSIGLYYRMSFAYMVNFEPLDSSNVDTKFIYIRNSNGPSTEPCGTPDLTGVFSEHAPSTTTNWCLSLK